MNQSKVLPTAADAITDVFDGATVCLSGFGPVRNRAMGLIKALAGRPEVKNLTIIANSFHQNDFAEQHQVKKLIAAFGGSVYRRGADPMEEQIRTGEITFEPTPQGILVERLRAGAAGIPAFYSPVGLATVVAEGKERRTFDGKEYLLETALKPDFAFIRAQKADESGNLVNLGSSLNFTPTMAAAARITIAEVDEIVPTGSIDPEDVDVPGIHVHRVVLYDKAMDAELAAVESQLRGRRQVEAQEKPGLTRELMALRTARLLKPGQYVNLGMGLPTLVGNFINQEDGVMLHAENGVLGYGPTPPDEEKVWYNYNAQSQLVSILPGASFFSSLDAFTMARGGRLDVVVLGGMQVSESGDLANWWAPYMAAGGMGGAMDLCTNVPELIVVMEHTTRDGEKRILNKCEYPLTAASCVTKIVTDLALIEVTPEGLVLKETAPGVTPEYIQELTEPTLIVAPDCREMAF
ncbi:MAG: 3-oxoacid CoA-transferase [Dehalococcoidia bacterium]